MIACQLDQLRLARRHGCKLPLVLLDDASQAPLLFQLLGDLPLDVLALEPHVSDARQPRRFGGRDRLRRRRLPANGPLQGILLGLGFKLRNRASQFEHVWMHGREPAFCRGQACPRGDQLLRGAELDGRASRSGLAAG